MGLRYSVQNIDIYLFQSSFLFSLKNDIKLLVNEAKCTARVGLI